MRLPARLLVAALLVLAPGLPSRAEQPALGAARVAAARAEAWHDFQAGRLDAAFERLKPLLADKTLDRRQRFSAAYLLSRLIERGGRLERLADVNAALIAMDAEAREPYRPSGPLMGHNLAQYYLAVGKADEAFRLSAQWVNQMSPIADDADEAGLYLALVADEAKALGALNRWQDAEFLLERGVAALAAGGAADPADVSAFGEAVGVLRLGAGLALDARHIFENLHRRAEQGLPPTSPDRIRAALWYGYALADSGDTERSIALLDGVVSAVDANPALLAGWRDLARLVMAFDRVDRAELDKAAAGLAAVAQSKIALYRGFGDMLASEIALLRHDPALGPRLEDIARRFRDSRDPDPSRAAYARYIAALAAEQAGHADDALGLAAAALDRLADQDARQAAAGATHVVPPTAVERRILEQTLRLVMGGSGAQPVKLDGERARLAFDIVQRLARQRAALGVSAASFRSTAISALDREQLRAWEALNHQRRALLDDFAATIAAREQGRPAEKMSVRDRLRPIAQLAIYHDKLLKMRASLAARLPDYLTATRFAHSGLGEFRAVLGSGEAAVFLVSYGRDVLTACVRDDGLWLSPGTRPKAEIVAAIESLRRALTDPSKPDPVRDARYDGETAYRLYQDLFGGVGPCVGDALHVIQVLDADLMLLPTAALLTAPPKTGERLEAAPWFVRKYAVSLLPSAASLVLLRNARPPSAAHQQFLGFGAPDLSGGGKPRPVLDLSALFSARGGAELAELRQLGDLPETAAELREIGKALGAPDHDIHLGADATEAALRRETLADFRIIDFATHGLLAREIDGLSEPAIVLTPGDGKSRLDDGLLTTTDIGELQLDADLVILSACNTAASDGREDARGLTGLANAFFGAGARSLIATQWPVDSAATRDLMIGLIGAATRPETRGIAYSLRDAMLKTIAAAGPRAHPRFWAPFVVAGDGRALARARPLAPAAGGAALVPDWQIVEGGPRFDEAVRIDVEPDGTALVSGVDGLGAKATRAGTFQWRVAPDGQVLSRRSVADLGFAKGALALKGGDVVRLSTTYSAQSKTDVVIHRDGPDGARRWSVVERSPLFETPGDLIAMPRGTILAAMTRNIFTDSESGSQAVVLLELDDAGRVLRRREIALPLCTVRDPDCAHLRATPLGYEPTAAFVAGGYVGKDGRLRLILNIEGRHRPAATDPQGADPVSGRHRRCGVAVRTAIWTLDDDLAAVGEPVLHENIWIESVVATAGGAWLAGARYADCEAEGDVFTATLDETGALVATISDGTALNEAATAVALSSRGEVLVAGRAAVALEVARHGPAAAGDPGAERGQTVESEGAALLLLYDGKGSLLASLAVPGRRLVRIRDVRFLKGDHFMIAGTIDGGQIWIAGYHIERPAR